MSSDEEAGPTDAGDLRLCVAEVTSYDVLVRGGEPGYGTGTDSRRSVDLS